MEQQHIEIQSRKLQLLSICTLVPSSIVLLRALLSHTPAIGPDRLELVLRSSASGLSGTLIVADLIAISMTTFCIALIGLSGISSSVQARRHHVRVVQVRWPPAEIVQVAPSNRKYLGMLSYLWLQKGIKRYPKRTSYIGTKKINTALSTG